jgi:mRNA interferase MazF
VISRGDVWWADLRILEGSAGFRQPVLVISDNRYNASRLGTAIIVVLSSTARLAALPGNVAVTAALSGLDKDLVVDVTHVRTIDRAFLEERVGQLPTWLMTQVDDGLRRALAL